MDSALDTVSSPTPMAAHNVPDDVVFGPDPGGSPLTYGAVRKLNAQARVEVLRRRFEHWLVGQSEPLVKSGGSAFPLSVMTCVGMEALGVVAYHGDKRPFQRVAARIDNRFADRLTSTFETNFRARWPFDARDWADATDMKTVGDVLYTFFRNSMVHGFRGRAVFLTEEDHESTDLTLREAEGTMILRPSWLWNRYVAVVGSTFDEIVRATAPGNAKRASAEKYVALMLK